MFNVWDNLGDAASEYATKYRARFGTDPPADRSPGVTSEAPILTLAQKQAAVAISKRLHGYDIPAEACQSIDAITGECAAFAVGGLTASGGAPTGSGGGSGGSGGGGTGPVGGSSGGGSGPGGAFQQVCSYPPPPQGCLYEPGPNFNARTNCGMVMRCPDGTEPGGDVGTAGRRRRSRGGRNAVARGGVVELCPIAGYVTRPVPGAAEYQVFKCTPGERVRIKTGLVEAGMREAYNRADVTAASAGTTSSNLPAAGPNWLLIGGIAIGVFVLFGQGKRR